MKNSKKLKKHLKTALKVLVTVGAIAYVLSSLDLDELLGTLKGADLFWLFLAFVAFNISKIISSVRLNYYFRILSIRSSEFENLRLYYMGMFYNLFLPGGISGDGYKVYLLHKRFSSPYKGLLQATLLDRISGLSALLFFAGILFLFSTFNALHPLLQPLAIIGVILVLPVTYYMTKGMFERFLPVFGPTTLYAFGVQAMQLVAALCIVLSLTSTPEMVDYLTLFLISSVIAVLPISIGGIGVRELTFLYGFELIGGDVNSAVSFSMLFFIITAISSMIGAAVKIDAAEMDDAKRDVM